LGYSVALVENGWSQEPLLLHEMGATILLIARNVDCYATIWRRFFFWKVDFIAAETGRWSVMRK
jgi:hypothetical protein